MTEFIVGIEWKGLIDWTVFDCTDLDLILEFQLCGIRKKKKLAFGLKLYFVDSEYIEFLFNFKSISK